MTILASLNYPASFWLGLVIDGITIGGIYALVSTGLTMIFGAAQIMNFAQGEFFMAGGYFSWFFISTLGVSYWLALPLTTIVMAGFGALFALTIFARVTSGPRTQEIGLVLTLGLSVVMQELALKWFGVTPEQPASGLAQSHVTIGGVGIQDLRLTSLGVAILALGALGLFLSRTRAGLAIRGLPQNRELARTVGIPARRINLYAIAIGTALSGLAAASIAPFYGVYPTMGSGFLYTCFAILFLGGWTNVYGTAIVSLLVGLITSLAGGAISATAASLAPLILIAIVALLRPHGIFGYQSRTT